MALSMDENMLTVQVMDRSIKRTHAEIQATEE